MFVINLLAKTAVAERLMTSASGGGSQPVQRLLLLREHPASSLVPLQREQFSGKV
jgi:hypothetical protein